jgi:hypothetical protein
MLAAGGWPRFSKVLWILVCMVLARSAGWPSTEGRTQIDADNPRTMMRAILAGLLSREFVGVFSGRALIGWYSAVAKNSNHGCTRFSQPPPSCGSPNCHLSAKGTRVLNWQADSAGHVGDHG